MFRVCGSRVSSLLAPCNSKSFQTTSASCASASRSKTKTKAKTKTKNSERPHIVLGHKQGDTTKWENCDLAKVLLTESQIIESSSNPDTVELARGTISVPTHLNFGLGAEEKRVLFEDLPLASAQMGHHATMMGWAAATPSERAQLRERYKAQGMARLLDLKNANAAGIAYENRMRCIEAFSAPGKANDTGRPEVQAAILTMRIRNLWDHLIKNRADIGNRRSLRLVVHQRAKILKYLKHYNRRRYDDVLPRLGLEPQSVEGELTL